MTQRSSEVMLMCSEACASAATLQRAHTPVRAANFLCCEAYYSCAGRDQRLEDRQAKRFSDASGDLYMLEVMLM